MFEPEQNPTTSPNNDATLKSISEHYAVNPAGGVIDTRDGEQVASVADLFPDAVPPEDPTPSAPASAKIPHSAEALSLFGSAILEPADTNPEKLFPSNDDGDSVEAGVHTPNAPIEEEGREELCHSVSPKGNKCDFLAGHPGKHEIHHMLGEEVWSSEEAVAAHLKEVEAKLAAQVAAPKAEEAILPIDAAATGDGLGTDPDALALAMAEQAPMTKAELSADLLASIPKMDNDSLATVGSEVEITISDIKVRHERELADHFKTRAAIYAEVEKRILANLSPEQLRAQKGKDRWCLPLRDDGIEAGIEIKREADKRIDVLRKLEKLVKPDEFKAAVYQEPLPDPAKLPWKANMTKLNVLITRYGENSEVGKIIREGTKYSEQSRYVFLRPIKQEPKNVTPIAGEAA